MATVWAPHHSPRIGSWEDKAYRSGWSATIRFDTLDELAVHMNERGKRMKLWLAESIGDRCMACLLR